MDVRRSAARFETVAPGVRTLHSFSFGSHYDPGNIGFGPLLAFNDELLDPGAGYDTHRHHGVRIVTTVVRGSLRAAGVGLLRAGETGSLDASAGLEHSEHNASAEYPVRFLQSWLTAGCLAEPLLVRLRAGGRFALPRARFVHVFVVEGDSRRGLGDALGAGDALRLHDPDGVVLTAGAVGACLHVWALDGDHPR